MDAEEEQRVSGRLMFDGVVPAYHLRGLAWELPISRLVAVGEYTNANGPLVDDYYFVFVEVGGTCRQASFYAIDSMDTLARLADVLKVELWPGLCSSAEWKTRVMWPEALRDQPLFELRDVAEELAGLASRVRRRLVGPQQTVELSGAVQALSEGAV